jgi:DNA-binding GntR family transcriptional regulator
MLHPERLEVARDGLRIDIALLLRGLILDGALGPDEQLVVEDLAAQMGVSQRPVREALILLDAEGYVTVAARRGTYVRRITDADIADRLEALALVAGMAAARSVTDADATGRAALVAAAGRASREPDADAAWVETLVALGSASGSERIAKELSALVVALAGRVRPQGNPDTGVRELLEAVLAAIEAGDPYAARRSAERLFGTCPTDLRRTSN